MDKQTQSSNKQNCAPINSFQEGDQIVIIAIEGGHVMQARLASMGIMPDCTVKIIKKTKRGPMILESKGAHIAIGRGMLSRIIAAKQ